MAAAREERVVAALPAISEAERHRAAAAVLLAEATERLAAVPENAAAMTVAAADLGMGDRALPPRSAVSRLREFAR